MTESEAEEYREDFERIDTDNDGVVSYDEWAAEVEAMLREDPDLKWEILEAVADYMNEIDDYCGI